MQRSKFITGFFLILLLCSFQDTHARGGLGGLWDRIFGINEPAEETTPEPTKVLEFIRIEAAGKSFMMGSPKDEDYRDDDENGKDGKQVEVNFTKDFEMMTTEVTQLMWFDIMKKNPSRFSHSNHCDNHIYLQNGQGTDVGLCPNHPVERVSWDMAQVFIEELNSLYGISGCDGTPESSFGCFRLPTEGEWEFAARARTITAYYFDADLIDDYAWFFGNSNHQTHPVGKLAFNDYGLFDMSGNVWEWTQDSWQTFSCWRRRPTAYKLRV